ncbi:hypothetical protein HanRHA438_Chr09g0401911 [Helianthus annuus]|uniref:Uncharacterized protein n=1 Tax=Helianthus annuus TaxID=4232 RepID=A0A9K3I5X2_HELAN|nr:hypothetical protein HanXRQr2_Chr09g0390381 [Helianthus annuus]KAJ0534538.1 hypothetical protein HanIR_Chr09g0420911 [Helianthus annuus]KAJ0542576.1 hypothetical protein HanHA89_Chr09g0341311 [Helianthus annuus]KAJ0707626.1 hypothetical protein HanLR1_Chr09g0320581 [Helianthus annuus]KAJ0711615.1 hypothetical protein HanOQP8_Chr09g0325821 [Helianthus annuus]
MLRTPLSALNCLVSCHVISLQILKNLNFTSNHTNILTYPYIFHVITYISFSLIT